MFYKLKKSTKKLAALGVNPASWLQEIIALYIQRNASQRNRVNLDRLKQNEIISFTLESGASDETVTKTLDRYGICVLENFVEHSLALEAGTQINEFLQHPDCRRALTAGTGEFGHEHMFTWQTDYSWSDNYLEVANQPKAVINIRGREKDVDDAGMVDIFGIEKLFKHTQLDKLEKITALDKKKAMDDFISTHCGYPMRQSHIYINDSVTRTRGPHIDNNTSPFKMFIYLTDVLTEGFGPYTYLPGSHKNRSWMSTERVKNAILGLPSTEVSSVSSDDLVKILGKAGTAVITSQSGIHAGWSQAEGHSRLVHVSNYY